MIEQRLEQALNTADKPVQKTIGEYLLAQKTLKGVLENEILNRWQQQFGLSRSDLAFACLPFAACYAQAPISRFYVGAVAIGLSGNFYFGANQEFCATAIAQTLHAEQSAVAHAWLAGETGISDIAVNYMPCGHCRQFLNELNTAATLRLHLPHCRDRLLHDYLPDNFGPADLGIEKKLFDPIDHSLNISGDALQQAAMMAANQAYAPYSSAISGVALQCGEQIICGRYAENAAFNPSLLPLQSGLNYRRLQGLSAQPVTRLVLAEKASHVSHREMTASLALAVLNLVPESLQL